MSAPSDGPRSAPVLVVCATHRDRRELLRLGMGDADETHVAAYGVTATRSGACISHDYASDYLERLACGSAAPLVPDLRDPEDEIDRLAGFARAVGVDGQASGRTRCGASRRTCRTDTASGTA